MTRKRMGCVGSGGSRFDILECDGDVVSAKRGKKLKGNVEVGPTAFVGETMVEDDNGPIQSEAELVLSGPSLSTKNKSVVGAKKSHLGPRVRDAKKARELLVG